jgi:serine protease AprX
MRQDQSKWTRASALWGRGGRAAILLTLVTALVLPAGAAASRGGPAKPESGRDSTPPKTSITYGVANGSTSSDSTVAFGFASSEHNSTFECQVDGGAFGSCSRAESHTLTGLRPGDHSFAVRAIDKAGNVDQQPAASSWNTIYASSASSASSAIPHDLYERAKADPLSEFRVIVELVDRSELESTAQQAQKTGKLKRIFRVIDGFSGRIPGWAIVWIAEHPEYFDTYAITEDKPLSTLGEFEQTWQQTVKADKLWSRQGKTCDLDALTGLQLNPACVPALPYVAPQAPAIAIVDSGVDAGKLNDFGARVVANVNFCGHGDCELTGAADGSGHGTMVAGIAGGSALEVPGVAQNAPLVNLRVADERGLAYTSDVIAAIDWIIANKSAYNIRVANFSIAGRTATSFRFDPLDKAVQRLWLAGVTVVAAAGNHGSPDGPVGMPSPANDPFVITVGALDTQGTSQATDDTRAPWSAYGRTADGFTKPELSAPGRHMVMPVPMGATIPNAKPERIVAHGYMWMSGTSFSTPVVAGLAAQLIARNPSLTPDQVKGLLLASATRLPGVGTGRGEVDAEAALAVTSPPNPNEGLYAFVSNGTFNADAWARHVRKTAGWTVSNWTAANWTEANWTEANWTAANWTESNWTEANWTAANWVE